jgi:hypothetical protein
MQKGNDITDIILVILLGILVQLLLFNVGDKETPYQAVTEFSCAYFRLDDSMTNRLCSELLEDEDVNVVEQYLNQVTRKANAMGYDISYMRSMLYNVKTQTLSEDENTAEVRITAKRRRMINPVYTLVAKLFFIGDEYQVDEVINVVKEDGKWKVCGNPYSLAL